MPVIRRGARVRAVLAGDCGKPRPVLVVQAEALSEAGLGSVLVCPLTTALTGTTLCGAGRGGDGRHRPAGASEVMVEKVTAVAKARLRDPIGEVDAETMRAVERRCCWRSGSAPVTSRAVWGGRHGGLGRRAVVEVA